VERFDLVRFDLVWFDLVWFDLVWFDVVGVDVVWFDLVWFDVVWFDVVWFDLVRVVVVRIDVVGLDLGRRELVVRMQPIKAARPARFTRSIGATVQTAPHSEGRQIVMRKVVRAAVTAAIAGGLLATATGVAGSAATLGAPGSIDVVAGVTGGRDLWACGWNGQGVDVALIDTGVTPVAGSGTVVNGPDLSFDGQSGGQWYLDGFGHGTHLASIINGHDPGVTVSGGCRLLADGTVASTPVPTATGYAGVAPGARVVNVKVGAVDGAVDVTQVIAGIDWVVAHRNRDGFNIRVLTLAYGVPSMSDAMHDPLSHAVEVARQNGIVVVASSGNDGTTRTDLAFPARNPDVVAVGAADSHGATNAWNWSVAKFADRGTKDRPVDVVVPGIDVQGLRVPGSYIDSLAPSASGDRFIRGSGTSQTAAVVAGLAAQLVQRYPSASADQIRAMLQKGAAPLQSSGATWSQGSGGVVARQLLKAAPANSKTTALATIGDAAVSVDRQDQTIALDGMILTANTDVQGNPWTASWATAASNGSSWNLGLWNAHRYSGDTMTATGWAAAAWPTSFAGTAWNTTGGPGGSWDGLRWNGLRWNGLRWNGLRWNGTSWDGLRWNGLRWNANTWT
jgi:serine protease AprX